MKNEIKIFENQEFGSVRTVVNGDKVVDGRVVPFSNFIDIDLPKEGDRVAQLIFSKLEPIQLKKGKVNLETNRGEGGYGSTGE